MSTAGNIAKAAFDVLTPDGQTERLIFRRWKGSTITRALENGTTVNKSQVETVTLKINPETISYMEPKITQKVQTSSPGRFIVFDWGTDLLQISISGNTGNLIPGIVQSGFNPLKELVDDVGSIIAPSTPTTPISKAFGGITPYAQNALIGNLTYHELLEMSPKYRVFQSLRNMYQLFDADRDVLTLEMGSNVYRGYFMDFSFTQEANSPWNWKYNVTFISLLDISKALNRNDQEIADNDFIDRAQ